MLGNIRLLLFVGPQGLGGQSWVVLANIKTVSGTQEVEDTQVTMATAVKI